MRRRGLTSVIGGLFFVIVMFAGFNLMMWTVKLQDTYTVSYVDRNLKDLDRFNERIEISQARIDGNRFNLTVLNKGSSTVHLVRLWVTNESASPRWHQKYELDHSISTGESIVNIGQNLGLYARKTNTYALKLVTERGNTAQFRITSNFRPRVELITPAGVLLGSKFTVMFLVTNNLTSRSNMLNIAPTISYTGVTLVSGPSPSSIDVLEDASTVVFKWVFQAPTIAGTLTFNASYVGAPSGVYATSTSEAFKASEAEGASTATFAAAAKRLGLIISGIPNPVDTAGSWGKWGIGVVNPLNRTVEVYGVAISSPHTKITNVNPVGNRPTSGWSVIAPTSTSNIVYWQEASPITIASYGVYDFRVEIYARLAAVKETPVFIEALTSEGKYLLTYLSSQSGSLPTINLYYTSNPANPSSNWFWTIPNVKGGVAKTFNVTVENVGSGTLDSRIKLLIIVPEAWTGVSASTSQTGWQTRTILQNPDGSTTISVDTTATTIAPSSIYVFKFTATPPQVTDRPAIFVLTTTTVYPTTNEVRVASAISETGVQVVP